MALFGPKYYALGNFLFLGRAPVLFMGGSATCGGEFLNTNGECKIPMLRLFAGGGLMTKPLYSCPAT
jgi:hypothetical protein